VGANNKKKKNYIGKQHKIKAVLPGIIASVFLLATILCISVVALFVFDHSSTKEGGVFYVFLPSAEQNNTEQPETNTTPAYEPADYVNLLNESDTYEEPGAENPEDEDPYENTDYSQGELPASTTEDIPTVEYLPYEPIIDTSTPQPPQPPIIVLPDTPFNSFSFYIPENSHLYEYFLGNNPHLSAETVVWKVNAHLHLPFYYVIHVNYNPNPLLVNPFYRLPPGFVPYPLVPVNNADCHLRATPETVAAFHALRTSARENGFDLSATSAYRTATRQAELFSARNYVDGVVARPYHSEHQTGRAIDLWGPGGLLDARGPSPTGRWVAENAHYYGFIIRYRADTTHITGFIYEPWHITYVTVEISMYMHENNIFSLEEFVARHPEPTLQRG